ncbi:MAG: Pvc16 family protein [Thermomicrobiales bacterium]
MLQTVHDVLRRLLYEQGRISPRDVDIAFEAPTRTWIERLTRPSLNLYLFGIQENVDLRQTSFQSTRIDGHAQRRLPPRRIDVRYMVSAHTTDADDEYRLLWRALVTLMKFPEIPVEMLPDEVQQCGAPLTIRVAQPDDSARIPDLWSVLGADPHPAFCSVVTAPADLETTFTSPLVLTRTVRFGQGQAVLAERLDIHIGGTVRDHDGMPVGGVTVAVAGSAMGVVTNDEGMFVLRNVPAGRVRLRATHPDGREEQNTIVVPSETYDIVFPA